jgi:integrase/recombinase XerD
MKQAKTLNEKELRLVLASCSQRRHAQRDRMIILLSHWAGLRAKEIASIKISNILGPDNKINSEFMLSAHQTKGNKARRVFLSTRLQKELATYLKWLKPIDCTAPLFISQKDTAFSANTMCQLIIHIYQQAQLTGATSHSGRRSFITNLAAKGVSVRVLAELAAHSSISTTQRYIDINDQQLRAAVELN